MAYEFSEERSGMNFWEVPQWHFLIENQAFRYE
jgi:hypothetical protein